MLLISRHDAIRAVAWHSGQHERMSLKQGDGRLTIISAVPMIAIA